MPEVVSVRFRNRGKVYYFDPNGLSPEAGQQLVVETSKGLELGHCHEGVHEVEESCVVSPLRPVVRIATEADLQAAEVNRAKEKAAFLIGEEKIRKHGLDMKLVDVEYSFDGSKVFLFFTSDGRVDFRELVKDLASVLHTRIQMVQIGVRDGAKMLGGLGICGRPFCCSTFLEEFQPVGIRMAKTQNLSLNPSKISGTCGRLMCCLKYEQDAYEHLIKTMPKVDSPVDTPKGKGVITDVSLLRRTVKVRLTEGGDNTLQSWSVDRLGYTVGGEYIAPLPEEEPVLREPQEPDLSRFMADSPAAPAAEEPERKEKRRRGGRHRGGKNGEKQPEKSAEKRGEKQGDKQNAKPGGEKGAGKQGENAAKGGEKSRRGGQNRRRNPQRGEGPGREQQPRGEKSAAAAPHAAPAPKEAAPGGEGGGQKRNYRRHYHRGGRKSGEAKPE